MKHYINKVKIYKNRKKISLIYVSIWKNIEINQDHFIIWKLSVLSDNWYISHSMYLISNSKGQNLDIKLHIISSICARCSH